MLNNDFDFKKWVRDMAAHQAQEEAKKQAAGPKVQYTQDEIKEMYLALYYADKLGHASVGATGLGLLAKLVKQAGFFLRGETMFVGDGLGSLAIFDAPTGDIVDTLTAQRVGV